MSYKPNSKVSTMLERDVKDELLTVSQHNNRSVARIIADAIHIYLESQSALRRENNRNQSAYNASHGRDFAVKMMSGTTHPVLK